jgi:hypothetical protein
MEAGAISQLRTFPGTATDALRLRTSPVASVDGAVKFWPDVSKTRLLIEGARVLTGVQRDEVATTTFRLLDRRLRERHAHAGPACLVVNNESFHSRVDTTVAYGRHVGRGEHVENLCVDFEDNHAHLSGDHERRCALRLIVRSGCPRPTPLA